MMYSIGDIFQDNHNQIWKCVSWRREPIKTIAIPELVYQLGDTIVGFRNIATDEYFEGTESQLSNLAKLNNYE